MEGCNISSGSEADDSNQDGRGVQFEQISNNEPDVDAELDYDEDNEIYDEMDGIVENYEGLNNMGEQEEKITTGLNTDDLDVVETKQSNMPKNEFKWCAEGDAHMKKCSGDEREAIEDGEIIDLEDGELRSGGESDLDSLSGRRVIQSTFSENHLKGRSRERTPMRSRRIDEPCNLGVCKFYLRGTCTWGPDCKYSHSDENHGIGLHVSNFSSDSNWRCERKNMPRNDRERIKRESIHSRIIYPYETNYGSVGNIDSSGKDLSSKESAWEKGLRQARELMIKASKKREEEPDFDRKRLILTPSDEIDRHSHHTDDDSDDSRYIGRTRIRSPRSPSQRNFTNRSIGGSVGRALAEERRALRYLSDSRNSEGNTRIRERDSDRNSTIYSQISHHRKIPSLIDTLREGRIFEPPKNIDLGPQVLYPSGRPIRRRERIFRRDRDCHEENYILREESRSPRSVSSSRSHSPIRPRRDLDFKDRMDRDVSPSKRRTALGDNTGTLGLGSAEIRDPWERNCVKRGHSREFITATLDPVQKGGRKISRCNRRLSDRSASSSVSQKASSESSFSASSRSSSHEKCHTSSRPSYMSAVPLKNVFDDDGSVRPTDLSSFRIPKRKMPVSSKHRDSSKRNLKRKVGKELVQKRATSPILPKRKRSISRTLKQNTLKNARQSENDLYGCGSRNRSSFVDNREDVSDDSSFSSSSSSSDDTEPAAYRRKRYTAIDDGLPTEGIPLSPEAAVEDVSSDEQDDPAVGNSPNCSSRQLITPSNESAEYFPEKNSKEEKDSIMEENILNRGQSIEIDGEEYIDNEVESERRAELLRQLKCVEEAIARKRSRPLAL
ncbi:unnamed protein product [Dracunculus medinensis]|uniref:C3H1-type domain-containing protein n=1 Tax=Dracunculus medinensis TaxID=318479 RepID=A0A0N4U8S9_DRAME|nr:unnamed protein product [Dracunculus medinensis]